MYRTAGGREWYRAESEGELEACEVPGQAESSSDDRCDPRDRFRGFFGIGRVTWLASKQVFTKVRPPLSNRAGVTGPFRSVTGRSWQDSSVKKDAFTGWSDCLYWRPDAAFAQSQFLSHFFRIHFFNV